MTALPKTRDYLVDEDELQYNDDTYYVVMQRATGKLVKDSLGKDRFSSIEKAEKVMNDAQIGAIQIPLPVEIEE